MVGTRLYVWGLRGKIESFTVAELTQRGQHCHSDDEECNKSIEDFDSQLERVALLASHTATSSTTCKGIK